VTAFDISLPISDKRTQFMGIHGAWSQQWRIILQDFGEDLKIRLTVLVGELPSGKLNL
jgi:hypothetical protein